MIFSNVPNSNGLNCVDIEMLVFNQNQQNLNVETAKQVASVIVHIVLLVKDNDNLFVFHFKAF